MAPSRLAPSPGRKSKWKSEARKGFVASKYVQKFEKPENTRMSINQISIFELLYVPRDPHESLVCLDLVLVVAVEEGDDAANRVVQPHEVRRRLARRYGALQVEYNLSLGITFI